MAYYVKLLRIVTPLNAENPSALLLCLCVPEKIKLHFPCSPGGGRVGVSGVLKHFTSFHTDRREQIEKEDIANF